MHRRSKKAKGAAGGCALEENIVVISSVASWKNSPTTF
jgi:hypothetical protein